jgi:hypothetical protein
MHGTHAWNVVLLPVVSIVPHDCYPFNDAALCRVAIARLVLLILHHDLKQCRLSCGGVVYSFFFFPLL